MSDTIISRTYQTLLTTTHETFLSSGTVHDNVFDQSRTMQWLREGGRLKIVDGGERLREGLMYGMNSTAGWYSGYGLLNVTPQEGVTIASFNWKQGSVSISYSGLELRSNKGKAKIADLVNTKEVQAELSIADTIATGIFSDGTGTGNLQLTGLQAVCESTPGTTSYAGVPVDNTAWRNRAQASAGAAAVNLLPYMRTIYNQSSQGKGMASSVVDFIVTTRSVHESFEALHVPTLRNSSAKEGDLGFNRLRFKGAEVAWDPYCTSGCMYFLNSRHIMLVVERDANLSMAAGGFQRPVNQDGFVAQILFQGNITTNNRRKLGVIAGLT